MSELISELLIAKLKKCKDLPSPPGVAAQIINLSAKPNSDLETLAELVSMDPALSTKILRMANSSLYMRRVEAESIQQAVMMFGWTGTLNIALSFSVVGAIKDDHSAGLDYNFFWNRSLAAAVAARKLAETRRHPRKDELFLPALLQDIGMLALDRAIPDLYTDIGDKQQNHEELYAFEHHELSSDHAAIGAWLLNRWQIPERICQLVEHSHITSGFDEVDGIDALSLQCISLSGLLADCICCEEQYKDYNLTAELAESMFDIDITDFLSLIGKVTEEFQEMAHLFDMDVGDSDRLETTAEQAKKVLLRDAYGVLT